MIRDVWYTFTSRLSNGLHNVPVDGNIHIINSDGYHNPKFITLVDSSGLDDTITIDDFLTKPQFENSWKLMFPEAGGSTWHPRINYYHGDIVTTDELDAFGEKIEYISLTGTKISPNVGNDPITDTTNWEEYNVVKYITTKQEVTVGANGEYQSVDEALRFAGRFMSEVQYGYSVVIKILAGHVIDETIFCNGGDYSHIEIVTENDPQLIKVQDRSKWDPATTDTFAGGIFNFMHNAIGFLFEEGINLKLVDDTSIQGTDRVTTLIYVRKNSSFVAHHVNINGDNVPGSRAMFSDWNSRTSWAASTFENLENGVQMNDGAHTNSHNHFSNITGSYCIHVHFGAAATIDYTSSAHNITASNFLYVNGARALVSNSDFKKGAANHASDILLQEGAHIMGTNWHGGTLQLNVLRGDYIAQRG